MKNYIRLTLVFVATFLVSCAALDAITGTNPDGSRSPGNLLDIAAPFANGFLPGAGYVITGLGGLWAAWRGRKWRALAESTFDVIEDGGEAYKNLKRNLNGAHSGAGVSGLATKIVRRYKKSTLPI